MIYCNLSILLAERKLTITKVSAETGISRTTLTVLTNNYWHGVQGETINTLCKYLDVTVGELFVFYPFEIAFSKCVYHPNDNTANIDFECNLNRFNGVCSCTASIDIDDKDEQTSVYIDISEYDDENSSEENRILETIFQKLPIGKIKSLKDEIVASLVNDIYDKHLQFDESSGEYYGYANPNDWLVEVSLPPNWQKGANNGNR